jgi:4-amino-4-deoxy-L-arabinose transferase-like glycosyltransferase
MRLALAVLLVGYLPGALAFRLPIADRARRAALSAEERVFWHVVLSVAWSLTVALALAAAGRYSLDRLLVANAIVSLVLVLASRGRLFFGGAASRPTWTALLPLAIIALGLWRFLPPSEYIIGGKDPGSYVSEGVQISKTSALVIPDRVAAAVPADDRPLFFPAPLNPDFYSNRFMGFFFLDAGGGRVVGQFPHLYPLSIALGYDVAGLRGALLAVVYWAVFGLVAVYFAGARLVGRPAAFAAVVLLGLHLVELWFARYPNAEVVMQALLFAALLALARAQQDGDRFFGLAAGVLVALLLFLKIDALLVILAITLAAGLAWLVDRKPPRLAFIVTIAAASALAWLYLTGPLRPYFFLPVIYLRNLPRLPLAAALGAGALFIAALLLLRDRFAPRVRAVLPVVVACSLIALAIYAMFFRHPGGKLADADAYALRTFVNVYLFWPGLVLALAGLAVVARRHFWRDPAMFLVFAAVSVFLFYKIKIVPEHFWMGRRFLPVILPVALLMAAAAALGSEVSARLRGWRLARALAGVAVLTVLAWQYGAAAAPLVPHREYENITRTIQDLASRFSSRDLVIVEGRDAGSDAHVLALPLAYLYDRNVLVLFSPRPDKGRLAAFLDDAFRKYARVLFIGGGGTDLLSRRIGATPIADKRMHIKEYAVAPWNGYPEGVRRKDFDYSIYALHLDQARPSDFVLDLGFEDDLHVVRFHAKEQTEGRLVRWTGPQSFIAVPGLTGRERVLQFVMHDGGRPAQAEPAQVRVFFNEAPIATIKVGKGFTTYTVDLPPDLVQRAALQDDPAQIRLLSTVWIPKQYVGGTDDRPLGVMIDKVEIH